MLKTTYLDNPWFPPELEAERAYLARVDPDAHRHVWEGECRTISDAQILKGKYSIEAFEPQEGWNGPYLGLDFGFSQSPTAAIKCWVNDQKLYLEHEVYKVGCDIDKTPALLDQIPDARNYTMRADCSRPETISYLRRNGYGNVVGVEKWSGSVEDGIAHLRSYEQIVIHPRCVHAIQEARLYSYKVDRLSGDVLPDVIDKHNHIMDSLRYALVPLMKRPGFGLLEFMERQSAANNADVSNQAPQGGMSVETRVSGGANVVTLQPGMTSLPRAIRGQFI